MVRGTTSGVERYTSFGYGSAFVAEALCLALDAAGEFRIERTVVLHDAPIRSDTGLALAGGLLGGFGGNADEDPGDQGQAVSVEYWAARSLRISETFMTVPAGIARMTASTSRGLGISSVPVPSRFCIFGGMATTLGRAGLSIFSRQLLRVRIAHS
jgi:hypothetical protein